MIKAGDRVTRLLSGTVPHELTVTAIDDRFIYCGAEFTDGEEFAGWKFDKTFGYEVDEDLGWGVPDIDKRIVTGSYLVLEKEDTYASASAGESKDLPAHRATGERP